MRAIEADDSRVVDHFRLHHYRIACLDDFSFRPCHEKAQEAHIYARAARGAGGAHEAFLEAEEGCEEGVVEWHFRLTGEAIDITDITELFESEVVGQFENLLRLSE